MSHRRRISLSILVLAALVLPLRAWGQQQSPELPQASPNAKVKQRVGVTDVTVEYSSPGVKGRKIWGDLVPYDKMWRTGANAGTKLDVRSEFMFGDQKVPAGSYALVTIPGKDSWTVILNRNTKMQAGTGGYDEKKDAARITVKPEVVPMRERMTFVFSDTTDDSTRLDLEWEKLRISIPLKVDTKSEAMGNIDKSLADAWRPYMTSARWLLDNNGDLKQALTYADTSITIKPTWWNNWVKAQILAKQGQKKGAVTAAEQAQTLGKDDPVFTEFFAPQVTKSIAEWKKG